MSVFLNRIVSKITRELEELRSYKLQVIELNLSVTSSLLHTVHMNIKQKFTYLIKDVQNTTRDEMTFIKSTETQCHTNTAVH